MEVQGLFFCFFLLWIPLYLPYLIDILPGYYHFGNDAGRILWKIIYVAASLGICALLIFSWRTIIMIKTQVYQVSSQKIVEKINHFMKDSTELEENLFTWKQKVHKLKKKIQEFQCQDKIISNETVKYKENIHRFERTNNYLNSILQNARIILESQSSVNVNNQDLSKRSVEIKSSGWNDLRTRRHKLEDMKTTLEESCNQLRFLKKIQEMEQNQLKRKDIFTDTLYEQDIVKFKEELKMKQQERVKLDKQLSWSKEMLEFAGNKTEKFRQQVEDKKKQLWQIEFTLQQDNQFKMDPKL